MSSAATTRGEVPFDPPQALEILARPHACVVGPGALCWSSPARIDAPGPPLATAGSGSDEGRFTLGRSARSDGSEPSWSVEVDARLRRRAWAGNALFIFYDLEDPSAIERREVTALWQAPVAAGEWVAARLALTSDDGFRPEHIYRLRIAQLIANREVVLAEGELRLR